MSAYLRHPDPAPRTRGQALVEFALVFPAFLLIVLGIVDVGRGIFVYNGVSQAAREIARVTSVYPGAPFGSSTQTQAVVARQASLVPGLGASNITIECTDMADTVRPPEECFTGTVNRYARVSVSVPFNIVAKSFLPVIPVMTFTSVSHIQLP
jgi:Flp pilus assembly protein TadG